MALIKCPECGKEISDQALSCPQCGFVNPAKTARVTVVAPPPIPSPTQATSAAAIWSLVLGILGLAVCVIGIPGVICGHLALSRIKSSQGKLRGRGLATGGLITGYLGIIIGTVGLISMGAAHKSEDARQAIIRKACIGDMRMIQEAKQTWASKNKMSPTSVPTWEDISKYIGSADNPIIPHCPGGGQYSINDLKTAPTCTIPGHVLER